MSIKEADEILLNTSNQFIGLFTHGTLSVEYYKPLAVDNQEPHDRDEIYVVARGCGDFLNDGKIKKFAQGDFLLVKAGVEHRFLNFSDDFSTWVFFYGPKGGESETT
ncbi:MAG: cupin domain-containing protein [Bacteroidota bacterium]|nr:cupin domain-containing protein [Bacteroidota bacterium]